MRDSDPTLDELGEAVRRGDEDGVAEILERYRGRLRRMVDLRLDPRVRKRLDPSDVLQEAYLEILDSLDGFLADPRIPLYLWLRFITGRTLLGLHRRHLDSRKRDARREVPLQSAGAVTSSISLADFITSEESSPSGVAQRRERHAALLEALEALDPIDREILTLRYFEELSNRETATMLGLNESTASTRFVRALRQMKGLLDRSLGE